MDNLLHDLRYSLRLYMRNPLIVIIVVATLGIGIGANTAVFSAVNSILLKPMPYADSQRLAALSERSRQLPDLQVSYPDYLDWKQRTTSFFSMGAYEQDRFNVSGFARPERVQGCRVSANFLSTLGVAPLRGRDFSEADNVLGAQPAALISYSYWKSAFGNDTAVLGKQLSLDGREFTVVGVLPSNFRLVLADRQPSVYVPIGLWSDKLTVRNLHAGLWVIAKRRESASWSQAQAEMSTVARDLEREHPSTNTGIQATVAPLSERVVRDSSLVLTLALGAVAFVLLIACANVSSLMLAWGSTREREISVRAALGATQARLFTQIIVENVFLALLGGILGLLLSASAIRAMQLLVPDSLRDVVDLKIDSHVLLFASVLSIITGLLFGCLPALRFSRLNLNEGLREGQKGTGSNPLKRKFRNAVVIAEVGVSLVLLISAQLMVASTRRLLDVNPGFDPDNLLIAEVALPQAAYSSPESVSQFYRQLLPRLNSVNGIKSASIVTSLPLSDAYSFAYFSPEGSLVSDESHTPLSNFHVVDSGYFQTMRIPVLRGRNFDKNDSANAPLVTIVDQAMAKRYWPGKDPIGRRIKLGTVSSAAPWAAIVGVAGDTRQTGLSAPGEDDFYLHYLQRPQREVNLVARTGTEPFSLTRAVEAQVQSLNKDLPIANVRTMRHVLLESVAPQRVAAVLLGVLAGLGLLLSSIGIYAMLFHATRRRTREIGVRMALGADRFQVLRLIMMQSIRLIGIGLVTGWIAAFAAGKGLQSLLFSIDSFDPLTYVIATGALFAIGLVASLIPALYASRVDPTVAFSTE